MYARGRQGDAVSAVSALWNAACDAGTGVRSTAAARVG
jgi:hypothetical protein